jgi:putative PEP-CTERM system TPR-repeat lipoprotein
VRAPGNQDVRKRLAAIYLVESKPERVVEVLEPVLKKSPQWQILMMAGAAQYDLGNYDIASQLLQKARMLRPDNANAKWQLARVRAAQDRLPEAIDLLENLDPESPVYRHAMLFLAGLQIKSQQLDKAIANAKYLTQAEPQNHAAWDVLGSALAAAQQEAAAREAFASALRLKPGYLPVQLKLASLDILGNRLQQARERYQTILTKTPYELQVMSALAELERRAGNLDAAISVREKILEFHPDALTENLKLAELYIEADRTKKASDLIQTLEVQYRDNFDVRFARVLLEIATGKLREAKMSLRSLTTDAGYEVAKLVKIAQYQIRIGALDQAYWSLTKAADAAPDAVYLHKNLIQLELKLNKPDKALERASKLLAQDPQDAASELFVGDAQLAKGNPDAALSAYWRAHAIAPSSLTVMHLQGLMQQTGETGQALKLMQEWLQQHPEDVVVRERLGMAQIAAGRYRQALLTHEWLVRQPAPSAQLLNHTAMLYQMQQNPKAMEYAKRAYKLAPDDPYVIDTLGWTYIENGEPLLGLQYLRDALSRDTQDPTIRYHTALALTRLERYQEAQAMLTPLLAENKPFLFKTQAEELQQQLREKLAGH